MFYLNIVASVVSALLAAMNFWMRSSVLKSVPAEQHFESAPANSDVKKMSGTALELPDKLVTPKTRNQHTIAKEDINPLHATLTHADGMAASERSIDDTEKDLETGRSTYVPPVAASTTSASAAAFKQSSTVVKPNTVAAKDTGPSPNVAAGSDTSSKVADKMRYGSGC